MVLDKVNNSNNTPAASHILGWRQLENFFDSLGRGLGSGMREYEAQKFYFYCHDVALFKVDLHPRCGYVVAQKPRLIFVDTRRTFLLCSGICRLGTGMACSFACLQK